MARSASGPPPVSIAVTPYAGDEELSSRLRACDARIGVADVRHAAEIHVTRPSGVRRFLGELLRNVQTPDELSVAALLECALGLWNEHVQDRLRKIGEA